MVEDLIVHCGEYLRGSDMARVDRIGSSLTIASQVVELVGSTVQFTLVSVGSSVSVVRGTSSGFSMAPVCEASLQYESVPTADITPLSDTVAHAPPTGDSQLDEIFGSYAPQTSTMRRSRSRAAASAMDSTVLEVDESEDPQLFAVAVQREMAVIPTSGEGLLCGARAIRGSLAAIGKSVQLPEAMEAICKALTQEQKDAAAAAGVPVTDRDFTADQLAAGLRQLGDYRLVVLHETDAGVHTFSHGGTEKSTPVLVHNQGGHWSTVGPGKGRKLRVSQGGRVRPS